MCPNGALVPQTTKDQVGVSTKILSEIVPNPYCGAIEKIPGNQSQIPIFKKNSCTYTIGGKLLNRLRSLSAFSIALKFDLFSIDAFRPDFFSTFRVFGG